MIPTVYFEIAKKIDWTNPNEKISKYFTVKEAIWLDKWGRLATPADGLTDQVKAKLVQFFREKVDRVREKLGRPMFSKSCFRPDLYNKAIGGARLSCHRVIEQEVEGVKKVCAALDFWCDADGDGDKDGEDCDLIKDALRPHLEEFGIRMEKNGKGARWVHVDDKDVPASGNREFDP
jgi:hypothetical protein